MSKQTAHEFIEQFFAIPEEQEPVERKSYKRFKAAVAAEGVSEDTLRKLFEAATGKTATYVPYCNVNPEIRREDRKAAMAIVDAMDGKPTSITDLAERATVNFYRVPWGIEYHHGAYKNNAVRKCLHEMGKAGIIGMVEVSTCGKCAIRLYNAL